MILYLHENAADLGPGSAGICRWLIGFFIDFAVYAHRPLPPTRLSTAYLLLMEMLDAHPSPHTNVNSLCSVLLTCMNTFSYCCLNAQVVWISTSLARVIARSILGNVTLDLRCSRDSDLA
jgi:hypothetical protein